METTIELLQAEKATLQAGYDAARLEIASLVAQLNASEKGKRQAEFAAECFERDVQHLTQQMAAIGAGGVEPLRRRQCLHQIAEPKQCTSCA